MTSRRRSTYRRTAVGLLRRVLKPWGGTRRRTERRGGSCCRSVSSILPIEKSPSTELYGCRERKLDSRDRDARFHERELRFSVCWDITRASSAAASRSWVLQI